MSNFLSDYGGLSLDEACECCSVLMESNEYNSQKEVEKNSKKDCIILYSTHCPKCNILEHKLKEKNIDYTECNDTEEIIKQGFYEAPILKVGDEYMNFGKAIKWVNGR